MIARRDLSIKVMRGMFGGHEHYMLSEYVTVLMKDDSVFIGKISSIDEESFNVTNKDGEIIKIAYDNMANIANSDWLGDEDIREV